MIYNNNNNISFVGLIGRNEFRLQYLVEVELLLLELLLVLLQELLVLLLDHQLLQRQGLGVSLGGAPLGQRGRLGPSQRPVLPLQFGHGGRGRHGQATHA